MRAWVISKIGPLSQGSLTLVELPEPEISADEILIKVLACGVCHTELDEIEGRAKPSFLPIIPGHQIVGEVVEVGKSVKKFKPGDLAGAGWIYSTCGRCKFCKEGLENLCSDFKGTGKDAHGGYAEYFKIKEDFAFKIPEGVSPVEIAPLFCAGAIGYRALKLANLKGTKDEVLCLCGFGASNHLVLKMAKGLYPKLKVFVYARNPKERELALALSADLALDFGEAPPEKFSAIIDTTPVWKPPFSLLQHLAPGGRLVINNIRKEEVDKDYLLNLDYARDLWLEREIKSVANITRKDIEEFLEIAFKLKLKPEVVAYPFESALEALFDLKEGKIKGAKVLVISS
ncbi:MAG: alcohol dehydrogenase catalytic domain-containing protein [Thermodesulfobacterium sp.]|nr:alcohol dehydrogenase catalytic domain-containing protein [Thermodesulfobacterium sp.]